MSFQDPCTFSSRTESETPGVGKEGFFWIIRHASLRLHGPTLLAFLHISNHLHPKTCNFPSPQEKGEGRGYDTSDEKKPHFIRSVFCPMASRRDQSGHIFFEILQFFFVPNPGGIPAFAVSHCGGSKQMALFVFFSFPSKINIVTLHDVCNSTQGDA